MKQILQRGIRGVMCLYLLHGPIITHAQQAKPVIDSTAYRKWPKLEDARLSPDGKYVTYVVRNEPQGYNTMYIRSVTSSWENKVVCREFNYSSQLNNRYALYQKTGDSLAVVELGKSTRFYQHVKDFRFSGNEGNSIIGVKDKDGLFFLGQYENTRFSDVQEYDFVLNNTAVLLQRNAGGISRLSLADLRSGKEKEIWRGRIAGYFVNFNDKHDKLIFLSAKDGSEEADALVYSDLRTFETFSIRNAEYPELVLAPPLHFNKTDEVVGLELQGKVAPSSKPGDPDLKIWRYNDDRIQEKQEEAFAKKGYRAVINLKERKLVRLQQPKDIQYFWFSLPQGRVNYELIAQTMGDCSQFESNYMQSVCKKTWYLLNIRNGERRKLDALNDLRIVDYVLSPDERYVFFFDYDKHSYFSYNLETSKLTDITKSIRSIINYEWDKDKQLGYLPYKLRGLAGWIKDKPAVLLYDNYDIWVVDLDGKVPPRNMTNGYGRKNGIRFFMPGERNVQYSDEKVRLLAFNLTTKDNGFFSAGIIQQKEPELLTMGPYMYYLDWGRVDNGGGKRPVKANESETYVVRRETSASSPNYFVTKDFKKFKQVSFVYPEKDYNWITTELHTWQMPDGMQLQGVLYKPADFDSSKKYPVIFSYYESQSNALNDYYAPAALCDGCHVNPPLLASKGYLVFKPDIRYKADHAGEYAKLSIESAAKHLSQFAWVDTSRMGLQGCSWGGYETNYIAAHSRMFKAACTAAGVSDPLTAFSNKSVRDPYFSIHGQHRFISTPWENPDAFLEGSLLYHANKMQTPLLIMHTTIDDAVPFNQAMQFFLSLRVLQRPVWMLQYSGEGANHGLQRPQQADDFSIRMLQFFDHYLKDKPAPEWMANGAKVGRTELVNKN